jgi:hypothetical protein
VKVALPVVRGRHGSRIEGTRRFKLGDFKTEFDGLGVLRTYIRTVPGRRRGDRISERMSASLIGHLGSSTFRLSTTAMSMSLAGSCFSSESAPVPLYGVFFVKEFARAATLSFVGFLVRSQSPFLRPDLRIATSMRADSVQGWLSPRPCGMLRPCQAIPWQLRARRPANAVAMTIRGEPAFGRGSVAPQPCIR